MFSAGIFLSFGVGFPVGALGPVSEICARFYARDRRNSAAKAAPVSLSGRLRAPFFEILFGTFFDDFGLFFGGTPIRDHFLRPRCADGHLRRPRDIFLQIVDGFWVPFWDHDSALFATSSF